MIKIEKLSDDARVLITRNGKATQVFAGQLVAHQDWQTVDVVSGSVTYSIDEQEIRTLFAPIKDVEIKTVSLDQETTKVQDPVEVAVTATPAKPKINMRSATTKK